MTTLFANPIQWILGCILIFTSLGVILAKKPVYSGLSFLLMLLTLSALYLQLSAQFVAIMQILVYAGAILVIFMYVIVLFQDAHLQIDRFGAKSSRVLLWFSGGAFLLALIFLGQRFIGLASGQSGVSEDYGTVQSLGKLLYLDFFFPFEAVTMLFLVALVGALYVGKKES